MSSSDVSETFENQIIENRFVVGQSIGKGSFGEVYDGYDNVSGMRVAIKFESHNSTHKQLENEYKVRCVRACVRVCLCVIKMEFNESKFHLISFCTHRFIVSFVVVKGYQMSTVLVQHQVMIIW